MKNPTVFLQGGYEVICGAQPVPGGKFSATLVVASDRGGFREETTVPLVHAPDFDSEADAITHAIGNGQQWVKDNG